MPMAPGYFFMPHPTSRIFIPMRRRKYRSLKNRRPRREAVLQTAEQAHKESSRQNSKLRDAGLCQSGEMLAVRSSTARDQPVSAGPASHPEAHRFRPPSISASSMTFRSTPPAQKRPKSTDIGLQRSQTPMPIEKVH